MRGVVAGLVVVALAAAFVVVFVGKVEKPISRTSRTCGGTARIAGGTIGAAALDSEGDRNDIGDGSRGRHRIACRAYRIVV